MLHIMPNKMREKLFGTLGALHLSYLFFLATIEFKSIVSKKEKKKEKEKLRINNHIAKFNFYFYFIKCRQKHSQIKKHFCF